jgi:hypothetical protein
MRDEIEFQARQPRPEIDLTAAQPRAVALVLPLEWAQAVVRLQQLHNQGCTLVRLLEDDRGRVRVEPDS